MRSWREERAKKKKRGMIVEERRDGDFRMKLK
jgi:hypothetical protein